MPLLCPKPPLASHLTQIKKTIPCNGQIALNPISYNLSPHPFWSSNRPGKIWQLSPQGSCTCLSLGPESSLPPPPPPSLQDSLTYLRYWLLAMPSWTTSQTRSPSGTHLLKCLFPTPPPPPLECSLCKGRGFESAMGRACKSNMPEMPNVIKNIYIYTKSSDYIYTHIVFSN